jgi:hypothetical protein
MLIKVADLSHVRILWTADQTVSSSERDRNSRRSTSASTAVSMKAQAAAKRSIVAGCKLASVDAAVKCHVLVSAVCNHHSIEEQGGGHITAGS